MRAIPISLLVAALMPGLKADELASPDKRFTIVHAEPLESDGYVLQRASILRGKQLLWEYASRCRALKFSWSPDSKHCLFAQWNGESRDVSLFVITLEGDETPTLRELDLEAVHDALIAPIPKYYDRKGGFAPVKFIEWDGIQWLSPDKCRMRFIDRDTGLDSEATIEVDLDKKRPKLSIVSSTDKIAERGK